MKRLVLFFVILAATVECVSAQDSLVLKDTKALGLLLSDNLKLDRSEVKKFDTELFFLLINIKDSAFSNVEILSKENAGNRKALSAQIPSILKGFKSVWTKNKTIIFPLLVINSERHTPDYDYIKKLKPHSDELSAYSSGMVILVRMGPNKN